MNSKPPNLLHYQVLLMQSTLSRISEELPPIEDPVVPEQFIEELEKLFEDPFGERVVLDSLAALAKIPDPPIEELEEERPTAPPIGRSLARKLGRRR